MSEVELALEAIESFVALARRARRKALAQADRAELTNLDEHLRAIIDGARPAPRRIAGPSTAETSPVPDTRPSTRPHRPDEPEDAPRPESRPIAIGRSGPASRPSVSVMPVPESASMGIDGPSSLEGEAPSGPPEGPSNASPTAHTVVESLIREPPRTRAKAAEIRIRAQDARKLARVGLQTRAESAYTQSRRPAFLDAYYEDAVDEVVHVPGVIPKQVVSPDGARVDISDHTLDLWNINRTSEGAAEPMLKPLSPESQETGPTPLVELRPADPDEPRPGPGERPPATRSLGRSVEVKAETAGPVGIPDPPSSAKTVGLRPAPPSGEAVPRTTRDNRPVEAHRPEDKPPAIVHLLDGATRRGFITSFDAAAGRLRLQTTKPEPASVDIPLKEILVIFFGRMPNGQPSPRTGKKLEVTLVNERRLRGFSPDYVPNGSALTVVPESERGGVDRVWVPAWSVQTLALEEA